MTDSLHKIVVSSDGLGGLEGDVSPHFGRCPAFTVVRVQAGQIQDHSVVENPFARHHTPGQVPAFLTELEATAVLAGGMGRRAVDLFMQNGIQASVGHTGTVRNAVETYLREGPRDGGACSGGHHPDGCAGHGV